MSWERVSDVREFMARRGTVRTGPHNFDRKVCHWSACKHCGLILLRNDTTRKARKKPCITEE